MSSNGIQLNIIKLLPQWQRNISAENFIESKYIVSIVKYDPKD